MIKVQGEKRIDWMLRDHTVGGMFGALRLDTSIQGRLPGKYVIYVKKLTRQK